MKRKMITGERLMYIDASTPLNVVFTIKIRGSFHLHTLQAALSKVQCKHPFLRVSIRENKNGRPYFVADNLIHEIPVRQVDRAGDDDWIAENKAEWIQLFNSEDEPLARVVWIKGKGVSELMLVCAHCVCDGKSIITLMSEIVTVMDKPETELKAYPLFGSVDELLPARYSFFQVIKARIASFAVWKQFYFRPAGRPYTAGDNYMFHWKSDVEITKRLIEACKKNDTTVHAALCVIFLAAFQSVLLQCNGVVLSPVDMRRFVPRIRADMMFAIAPALELSVDPLARDFWMKARKIKADMNEKIGSLNGDAVLKLSEYFPVRTMIRRMKTSAGRQDLVISNLGLLGLAEHYRSFDIETVYSLTAAFPFFNPNIVFVSTFKEQLDFCFCSNDGYLGQQEAAIMLEKVRKLISEETFQR
jgi:hypothetical protein